MDGDMMVTDMKMEIISEVGVVYFSMVKFKGLLPYCTMCFSDQMEV